MGVGLSLRSHRAVSCKVGAAVFWYSYIKHGSQSLVESVTGVVDGRACSARLRKLDLKLQGT